MAQKDLEIGALKAIDGTPLSEEELKELSAASIAQLMELGFDETDVVLIQNFVQQEEAKETVSIQEIRGLIKQLLVEKLM